MITRIVKINGEDFRCDGDGKVSRCAEYYGKSTDPKPIEGVKNAESFYEMDTKKAYLFDEEQKVWLAQ